MKIGVIGGTFDPIHNGHLLLAEKALKQFGLKKIIFIPTGLSYMKVGVSDAKHRFEMCKLAIEGNTDFIIDDVELQREGNTYTYETLRYLHSKYPQAVICFIIGLDTLFSIETWKNVSEVLTGCILLCANRVMDEESDAFKQAERLKSLYGASVEFIDMEPYIISSTEIRKQCRNGNLNQISGSHVPKKVAEYIASYDLYSKYDELYHRIKQILKSKRFEHTMGVVKTAINLAHIYSQDIEKVRIAALLHDCAKHMGKDEMIEICMEYDTNFDVRQCSTAVLHSKAGAILARTQYGIYDEEILDAIFYHTTGKPEMSMLAKIIFVSDYIEPNRTHSEALPMLRELALTDLNRTTALILRDTLKYLDTKSNELIDEMTEKAFYYYKKYL